MTLGKCNGPTWSTAAPRSLSLSTIKSERKNQIFQDPNLASMSSHRKDQNSLMLAKFGSWKWFFLFLFFFVPRLVLRKFWCFRPELMLAKFGSWKVWLFFLNTRRGTKKKKKRRKKTELARSKLPYQRWIGEQREKEKDLAGFKLAHQGWIGEQRGEERLQVAWQPMPSPTLVKSSS